jgi:hypothetical protein
LKKSAEPGRFTLPLGGDAKETTIQSSGLLVHDSEAGMQLDSGHLIPGHLVNRLKVQRSE